MALQRAALAALLDVLVLSPAASAAQQARLILWGPVIIIVWPHDAQGRFAPAAMAPFVNVSVWPNAGRPMPCVEQPEDLSGQPPTLYVARDNEPATPLGAGRYQLRNVDGAIFPTLEWDDVPVHRGADPTERDTFFVADANSNVWVHGGDLRTIAPQPVAPTGVSSASPAALDARIQIVWPHDVDGNYAPVSSARYVNVAVDLFAHGTLDSVPVGYQLPGSIDLYEAVGNGPLLSTTPPPNPWQYEGVSGYRSAPVVQTTYTVDGRTYPRWVFNEVPSTINFPDYFLVQVQGIQTYPTVWTNAADGRTSMPNPETPPSCTL